MSKILSAALVSISLLLSPSTFANTERQISVNGSGMVATIPNQLQFTVLLQQKGASSARLNQQLVKDSNSIIDVLHRFHVANKDIQSMQIQLSPWYERQDDGMQQKGFVLSRQIQITLRKLDDYDSIIDKVLSIGAARVENFQYLSSRSRGLYDQALQQAISDARHRAKLMADSADVKLGEVMAINENSNPSSPVPQMRMMVMKDSGNSYQPGEITIQAHVHMIFSIASEPVSQRQ